jgi:hypothetical protein
MQQPAVKGYGLLRRLAFFGLLAAMPFRNAAAQNVALTDVYTQAEKAVSLKEQEQTSPKLRSQRIEAFCRAASLLARYIDQSIPRTNLKDSLQAVCQLARYCEDGDLIEDAHYYYAWCLKQTPWVDDKNLKFKTYVLKDFATDRLAQVDKRLPASPVLPGNLYILIDRTSFHSMKGSITNVNHVVFGESHRPLDADEAIRVAMRRLPADQTPLAVEQGTALLQKEDLMPQTAVRPGMVVFGVHGSQESTDYLADALDKARKDLTAAYFDSGAPASLISVYACLAHGEEGELVGRRICRAVHFREKRDLEGYYLPLDNSVVLRKGLRDDAGQWYLGTALHELTHALVYAEFPFAPRWLDEGLATLQEEQDSSGPIDNYRLYYLRAALEQNKCPTVRAIIDPKSPAWYTDPAPLMAAAARYLALYLLQRAPGRNDLKQVYQQLRADPSLDAAQALQSVTGMTLDDLNTAFVQFVQGRNVQKIGPKWGMLQPDIARYIRNLPIPTN